MEPNAPLVNSLSGSELSLPWCNELSKWIGEFHLRCFFDRFQNKPWLGIVSSHDKRSGFASMHWQAALRSAVLLAKRQDWIVVCAKETPYFEAVERCCLRLNVPFIALATDGGVADSDVSDSTVKRARDCVTIAALSDSRSSSENSNPLQGIPFHDRAVIALSHRVFAVHVKPKGKIERALAYRLTQSTYPPASVYIALSEAKRGKRPVRIRHTPTSVDGNLSESALQSGSANANKTPSAGSSELLLGSGAIGWIASNEHAKKTGNSWHEPHLSAGCSSRSLNSIVVPTVSVHGFQIASEQYLVHCTRARKGPWPDQSLDQFHDEILQSPWSTDPHPLDTLYRILQQCKLISGTNLRRSPEATVCFSNSNVVELLKRREFQSHLARWDWEPYGIMFDREWLASIGAQPVRYVNKSESDSIDKSELPFCQFMAGGSSQRDWSDEREWRILGDLRLVHIPFDKAFVFVPTRNEAQFLCRISRWPIIYMDS